MFKQVKLQVSLPVGMETEVWRSTWHEALERSVKQVRVTSELEGPSCTKPSEERVSSSSFTTDIAKLSSSYVKKSSGYWNCQTSQGRTTSYFIIIKRNSGLFHACLQLGNPKEIRSEIYCIDALLRRATVRLGVELSFWRTALACKG